MRRKSKTKGPSRPVPPIVEPPPEFAEAIDRASEGDRIWFELHPDAEYRERPPIDGEFWPHQFTRADFVLVHQIRPGFRVRTPMVWLTGPGMERIQ